MRSLILMFRLLLPIFFLLLHLPLAGADAVRVLRVEVGPKIDGRLDDACWQQAEVLADFTQVLPRPGDKASERTEVRFCQDGESLFISVRCYECTPEAILAKDLRNDGEFSSDDVIGIALDTFGLERDGYFLKVNAAGARADGVFGKFSFPNASYDLIWHAKVRIDEQGWTVEIALPFKSLSFDATRDTWRINLERVIRHRQETVRWRGINPGRSIFSLEQMGELKGLDGAKQGLGLDFKPFVRGGWRAEKAGAGEGDFKFGSDLTWRITPSLTLLATYHTDFAETDVDERKVNLSRFPLFFAEKRDFFLQDGPLFNFGGLNFENTPFFSRRIGLGGAGQPVDIIGGGRLTGRIGDTNVALLNVWQEAHDEVEDKMLSVGRISQRVFGESSVGAIFTQGDPLSNGDATTMGVDFNYHNGHVPGGKILANAFVLRSDTDRAGGTDWAWGADVRYPNEPLEFTSSFRQWGEHYLPALGFLKRAGIREFLNEVEYKWRPNTDWLRSVELKVQANFQTDLSGNVVFQDHDIPMVTLTTPSLDKLTLGYTRYEDVVEAPFEMIPGVTVPAGDYDYGQFKAMLLTGQSRALSCKASAKVGEFYDGSIRQWMVGGLWRPSHHFSGELEYELRQISLPEGAFEVHVASAKMTVALSPELSLSTVVQYDSLSDDVGLNARLRWTYKPGNDFFVVFNQGFGLIDQRLERTTTEAVAKVGMSVRF